ncbi:hypothetical protein B9G39_28820 [Zooshikella ganghwensis]|uniref:Uncharacterized protein n=1 Tax=Zooshikella ganghwensis TaxID=202772 RepID=A0A4P9VFW0_9GAMM|nr:hypothetical protein B9G39_28820 [Zooshikella ganghwensis]
MHSVGGLVSFDVNIFPDSMDDLSFYINDEVVGTWNLSNKKSQHVEFLLPAGRHELKWVYQSGRIPSNTYHWIDNLLIPALPDSDNDGVIDGWEYTYFKSLDTNFKEYDTTLDTDQDGVTDINEAKALTDPWWERY